MIEVTQALSLIRQAIRPLPVETVSLADSVGRILAEPIVADLDAPPFDKSMVDGYAIDSTEFAENGRSFPVSGSIVAGQDSPARWKAGSAIQIMTGAALPSGPDAVVMLEDTSADSTRDGAISISADRVVRGQNILVRGSIYERGACILPTGHRIAPQDIGLLAEAGASRLQARRRPAIAVVSTGNELCPPDQKPAGGQIRNSNGPLLLSLVAAENAQTVDLGIVTDDEPSLARAIEAGLAADMLVLTGGVSAGMLDLVPRVLKAHGVRQVFHKVSMKPGKPVWFGVKDDGARSSLVFGLPGNPVSAFVCFHLLVREALSALNGRPQALNRRLPPDASANDANASPSDREISMPRAVLDRDHEIRGDRPTYWPSRVRITDGKASVEPLSWKGSADQRCLSIANCLAIFPVGNQTYSTGSLVEIRFLGS